MSLSFKTVDANNSKNEANLLPQLLVQLVLIGEPSAGRWSHVKGERRRQTCKLRALVLSPRILHPLCVPKCHLSPFRGTKKFKKTWLQLFINVFWTRWKARSSWLLFAEPRFTPGVDRDVATCCCVWHWHLDQLAPVKTLNIDYSRHPAGNFQNKAQINADWNPIAFNVFA